MLCGEWRRRDCLQLLPRKGIFVGSQPPLLSGHILSSSFARKEIYWVSVAVLEEQAVSPET